MFTDFDKVFNKKKDNKIKIPDSLLSYLNKGLPKGLHYVADDDGLCYLTPNDQEMVLSGYDFVLNDKQQLLLGKNYSQDDVLMYSYNSQQALRLRTIKEGIILINGEECNLERIVYDPNCPFKTKNGKLILMPPNLPDPFEIVIGGNGIQYHLNITRIPNESVNIAVFESSDDKSFKVKYTVDMKQKRIISFNITYNIKKANSAKEIVNTVLLYNACVTGEWSINGVLCDNANVLDDEKKYKENSIIFWKKLAAIEEVLDVSFLAPEYDIDFEMMCEVEEIFQCLINKNPIRRNRKTNSIDGKWEFDDIHKLNDSINKPIFLSFEGKEEIKILNVSMELPFVMSVFNSKLKKCKKTGNRYVLELDDNDPENPMYSSVMYFRSEDEMVKQNKDERFGLNTELFSAKEAREYLKEEYEKNKIE
ncbi:MAG: hypothetical protein J6K17_14295 [Oscillospiraceae bacterium]|nr:hypothetical protein [Oscillospiraceae bacterium]